MPDETLRRSEKWIWGKICGYKQGDKIRLICAYPVMQNTKHNPLSIPVSFPFSSKVLKPGTEGRIVQVITLADTTMYIVDFDDSEGSNCWVTEYEIEPVGE